MAGKKRHGHSWAGGFSKTYSAWDNMMGRCYRRKNDPSTMYWRGVVVCKRWHKFDNFLADMGEKPEGLTLDRIDGRKGYYPQNCRWASRTAQSRNTKLRSDNSSGHRGVIFRRRSWSAYIGVKGRTVYLGSFKTQKSAIAARKIGEEKYWGAEK